MSPTKTGDPRLLAEAVGRDPVSPDVEAFLGSLDLDTDARTEVTRSMHVLRKAITQGEGSPSITVYGSNWA
jgi:hypothetical protein